MEIKSEVGESILSLKMQPRVPYISYWEWWLPFIIVDKIVQYQVPGSYLYTATKWLNASQILYFGPLFPHM